MAKPVDMTEEFDSAVHPIVTLFSKAIGEVTGVELVDHLVQVAIVAVVAVIAFVALKWLIFRCSEIANPSLQIRLQKRFILRWKILASLWTARFLVNIAL